MDPQFVKLRSFNRRRLREHEKKECVRQALAELQRSVEPRDRQAELIVRVGKEVAHRRELSDLTLPPLPAPLSPL